MSRPAAAAAAAAAPVADAPAPRGGKKKLILVIAGAVVILAIAAAGALVFIKQQQKHAAEAAEDGDEAHAEQPSGKPDPKVIPTFVALDPFTVNLADREAERYAQVGITLELVNDKATDRIKAYMPAIRNNVLLLLAGKSSQQLMEREGKEQLAAEVLRESLRPLGYEPPAPGKRVPVDDEDPPPVVRVHFSNFIIQ
jgi:flagellar FliL protein